MSPRIATADVVGRSELLDFVRTRHNVVLVTVKRAGTRQLSPVTAGLDSLGRVVIATYPERAKTHNARRRPDVDLLVLSDDFGGPWVQLSGTAEVLDLPGALEPLVEYFRVIAGEHDDWDEYRAAMRRQGKSLIRVTIERWGPIATGGFPARLG
ncbi:MAG TPA: PPOX class F420-dependent oxidoreductase [Streptosporangiaceae bacterium]|nr:PPOX class F420-dependent oxidoreductase [Streptosporangiaceae bacterium]